MIFSTIKKISRKQLGAYLRFAVSSKLQNNGFSSIKGVAMHGLVLLKAEEKCSS